MDSGLPSEQFLIQRKRFLIGVAIIAFIFNFSTRIVDIILANFISEDLGGQVGLYTLFVSLFNLANFVALTPISALSDKFGRKNIISISLFGYSFGVLMFYFSTELWHLIIFRLIQGFSVFYGVVLALINDYFEEGNRSKPLAFLSTCLGIGFLFGSAAGGLFLEFVGGRSAFLYVGILDFSMLLFLFLFVKDVRILRSPQDQQDFKLQAKVARKMLLKNKSFRIVIVLQALRWCGFSAILPYLTWLIFNHYNVPDSLSGFLLFPIVLCYIFGLATAGRSKQPSLILKRFFPILTLSALSFLILGILDSIFLFILFGLVSAFCFGILLTANDSYAADVVPEEIRGESLGFYKTTGSFFGIIGPLSSGVIAEQIGFLGPFIFIALLSAAGWLISRFSIPCLSRKEAL
jgi:MFS family permease